MRTLECIALALVLSGCATRASPVVEPTTSLASELAIIDRARHALVAGDTATARTLVDDYALRYPSGTFSQEADVLRIQALLAQTDDDEAAERVARFLEANPNSPYGPWLRECAQSATR